MKNRQTAGRFEPSRAQSLLDTQKSLSERYLITFLLFEKLSVGKVFCWELWNQRGTKNRTMVRTFVPKCLLGVDFIFNFEICNLGLKTFKKLSLSVQILFPINILERKFVPWFDFSCLSGPKALSKKLFRPKVSQKAKK